MQVVADTNAGGRLGAALGTGLQQLAQHKLDHVLKQYEKQYDKSQYAKGLAPLLGQDTANFLSTLNPEERKYALQNIGSLMQLQGQPAQQQMGGLSALNGAQQPGAQQPGAQQQAMEPQQQGQMPPDRAQLIQDIFTSPAEKREREKLELAKKQINLKETKKYVDTLKDQEKAAKESDLRLGRMTKLIEGGKLPNANLWSFLTKIEEAPIAGAGAGALLGTALFPGLGTAVGAGLGGLVGALTSPLAGAAKSFIKTGSPDIEEFEKLSADFVKNAKQYFGSRLTDADLKIFMQTLPTLMQTDAGKKKVIENLKSLNELSEIEAKAARSIIKANGGIPPIDIEQQVKDKIASKIDKVAQRFIGL